MTTNVKVHVGGGYQATVTRIVQGAPSPDTPVVVGPGEERQFDAHGPRMVTFLIQEEPHAPQKDEEQEPS